MKSIFCDDRSAEEKLAATKRIIKLVTVFMLAVAGVVLYEVISIATGYRKAFSNLGQICATLGCLTCVLSLNIKRKKEIEALLGQKNE